MPRWHQDGPRCAQMGPDGAKMAPRWAVMDLRRLQNAAQFVPEIDINPKRPKSQKTLNNKRKINDFLGSGGRFPHKNSNFGAKLGQDGAKISQDGAKMGQGGTKLAPKWRQVGRKMDPRRPKLSPRWVKRRISEHWTEGGQREDRGCEMVSRPLGG